MINLRIIRLCKDILQHLLLGKRSPARFFSLDYVLSILLGGLPLLLLLLLPRFIIVNVLCNIILHVI